MYDVTEKIIPKLNELSEFCNYSEPLEDSDEEVFVDSVGAIVNELWELAILFRKLKQKG